MSEEKDNILGEDYEVDILILEDDDGVEHQFELVDTLEYLDEEYVALVPVFENPEDMLEDSGQLIIMKVVPDEEDDFLDPVTDDLEYDAVSELFSKRLADSFDFIDEDDDDYDDDDDDDYEYEYDKDEDEDEDLN